MAITITLNWTPGGGETSQNQDVQMRISGNDNWSTYRTVGPMISTIDVTGLEENIKYEFRIVDNCNYGGPIASGIVTKIKFTCPNLVFTNTYNMIQFAFNHLGGSVDQYTINLLNADLIIIGTMTVTNMTSVITGFFTGVSPNTLYQIQVIPFATGTSQECPLAQTTTLPPPECLAPTNVSAVLS